MIKDNETFGEYEKRIHRTKRVNENLRNVLRSSFNTYKMFHNLDMKVKETIEYSYPKLNPVEQIRFEHHVSKLKTNIENMISEYIDNCNLEDLSNETIPKDN